jgi:hypothetical protein
MGAPDSGLQAGDQPTAETLLTAFRTIKDDDRARHAAVLDYWLSIRGDKEFPPLHDLDPLEISDAASHSILFELLSGGQDAEIRHLGEGLDKEITVKRLIDAPSPSLASSIARKLPIVGISRDFLSFEDNFTNADGLTRCWITLLPLSSCGSWVDYVYAFVSLDKGTAKAAKPAEVEPEAEAVEEPVAEEPVTEEAVAVEEPEVAEEPVGEPETAEETPVEADAPAALVEDEPEAVEETAPEAVEDAPVEAVAEPQLVAEPAPEPEPVAEAAPESEPEALPEPEMVEDAPPAKSAGFSKILDGLSQLTGFYGQGVKVDEPVVEVDLAETEPLAEVEPADEPLELEQVAAATEPEPEPVAESEPEPESVAAAPEAAPLELAEVAAAPALEGTLQSKLAEVQAKADEAREAQVRATAALHEGLSAAYDFALDAETAPEEYLRLVEAQGLKIQLRAPMAPVAKLAFDGICDAATIRQFEAVLAWALKVELPRGALLERIQGAGGIPQLLDEFAKAA